MRGPELNLPGSTSLALALAFALVMTGLDRDGRGANGQSDHVEELHVGREWMETQL